MAQPKTFKLQPPPHMKGDDIANFQRELTKRFESWGVHKPVKDDGVYGTATRDAAQQVCKGLGILHEVAMKEGVTPELRIKIRDLDKRTPQEIERSENKDAKAFRAKLREQFKAVGLASVRVKTTGGEPHWGGSNDVMTDFIEPFMTKRGLPIGSGKRTPEKNASIGGSKTSDHLTTKTTTAARDFPTFDGEDDARALAKALGNSSWQPNTTNGFTVSVDGQAFRVQIIWGAAVQHGDHVHVGVSRV